MSEAKTHALHTEVQKLADDLTFLDGKICMSKEQALGWLNRARTWPVGDREAFALDLVIIARRLFDSAGAAVQEAVYLIAVLVVELTGEERVVRDMLQQAGEEAQKSAALLGHAATDLSKVGDAPPTGARSMLGLLGDKKDEDR